MSCTRPPAAPAARPRSSRSPALPARGRGPRFRRPAGPGWPRRKGGSSPPPCPSTPEFCGPTLIRRWGSALCTLCRAGRSRPFYTKKPLHGRICPVWRPAPSAISPPCCTAFSTLPDTAARPWFSAAPKVQAPTASSPCPISCTGWPAASAGMTAERSSTSKLDTVALFARRLGISVDAGIHDAPQGDVPFCVKQFFSGMSEEEASRYSRLCEDAQKLHEKT